MRCCVTVIAIGFGLFVLVLAVCSLRPDEDAVPFEFHEDDLIGTYVVRTFGQGRWKPHYTGKLQIRADGTYRVTMRERKTGMLIRQPTWERWGLVGSKPAEGKVNAHLTSVEFLAVWDFSWSIEERYGTRVDGQLASVEWRQSSLFMPTHHHHDGLAGWLKISDDPEHETELDLKPGEKAILDDDR